MKLCISLLHTVHSNPSFIFIIDLSIRHPLQHFIDFYYDSGNVSLSLPEIGFSVWNIIWEWDAMFDLLHIFCIQTFCHGQGNSTLGWWKPHPTWPWAFPVIGHPWLLWAVLEYFLKNTTYLMEACNWTEKKKKTTEEECEHNYIISLEERQILIWKEKRSWVCSYTFIYFMRIILGCFQA